MNKLGDKRSAVGGGRLRHRGRRAVAALLGVAACGGCGDPQPPQHPVSGQVTYNGVAIDEGVVTFLPKPETPGQNVAAQITAGAYSTPPNEGLYEGRYRVEIEGYRKTGRKVRDLAGPDRRLADPPMIEERESIVPPKFNVQSVLEVSIDAQSKQIDFPLRDTPRN